MDKIKELKESYLGFSVIKPLPVTFLGKTCLKAYSNDSNDGSERHYIHRQYIANLLGIQFSVDSVAYQEQDKVVSACATTSNMVVDACHESLVLGFYTFS